MRYESATETGGRNLRQKSKTGSGGRKWTQEVETGSGDRKWRQEVEAGSGDRKWRQEVETEVWDRNTIISLQKFRMPTLTGAGYYCVSSLCENKLNYSAILGYLGLISGLVQGQNQRTVNTRHPLPFGLRHFISSSFNDAFLYLASLWPMRNMFPINSPSGQPSTNSNLTRRDHSIKYKMNNCSSRWKIVLACLHVVVETLCKVNVAVQIACWLVFTYLRYLLHLLMMWQSLSIFRASRRVHSIKYRMKIGIQDKKWWSLACDTCNGMLLFR